MIDKSQVAAADALAEDRAIERDVVYVYEAPVRLWHWVNALCIVTLAATGYFIGSPLPSVPGEASDWFLMGYIRFAHFAAAYVLAVGFLLRIYWAFVGNAHARQLLFIPFWRGRWWKEVWHEVKWYAFIEKAPKKYVGHNPLAQLTMFFMVTLTMLFMIATGFALYSEGAGIDSWQHMLFGWVFDIWPNSQDIHTWHHLGMWVLITFVIMHVYVAVREDIMSRQSIISSMVSGERVFKDHKAD